MINSVKSIVPMAIDRSRITEDKAFTTERTDGKKTKVKTKEAKVSLFTETKLLDFYRIAGINFQNIVQNDALVSQKSML